MSTYPKFVHKDWKPTEQAPEHFAPTQSILVEDEAELKAALAKGFTEAPPVGKAEKPATKAEK